MENRLERMNSILDRIQVEDQAMVFSTTPRTQLSIESLRQSVQQEELSWDAFVARLRDMFRTCTTENDPTALAYQEAVRLDRILDDLVLDATAMSTKLMHVVDTLWIADDGGIFRYPVSERIAPGYHKVVKHPICLADMYSKIRQGVCTEHEMLKQDVQLMLKNCSTYNADFTPADNAAKALTKTMKLLFSRHRDDALTPATPETFAFHPARPGQQIFDPSTPTVDTRSRKSARREQELGMQDDTIFRLDARSSPPTDPLTGSVATQRAREGASTKAGEEVATVTKLCEFKERLRTALACISDVDERSLTALEDIDGFQALVSSVRDEVRRMFPPTS